MWLLMSVANWRAIELFLRRGLRIVGRGRGMSLNGVGDCKVDSFMGRIKFKDSSNF